jgi:signal peptidase II
LLIYLIISVALIAVDFAVKAWVVANIPLGGIHELIPGVISLTHIRNTGAAWSMFEGQQWFFYITTVIALGVVAFLWRDSKHKPTYRLGLAFILAGAIGNFIDRVSQQYVTDMFQLDFINFPIFNVADMCLTVGVILVVVYMIFLDKEGKA